MPDEVIELQFLTKEEKSNEDSLSCQIQTSDWVSVLYDDQLSVVLLKQSVMTVSVYHY